MSCGCGCGGEQVAYEDWGDTDVTAAEYQGRNVTLNKPFRTPGANKKFGVYTKNDSGNVVLVRFGDPNMEIKRDDPDRRKAFRSRHNCDSPGPKYKARYWSCRQWSTNKVEAEEEPCGCGCADACDCEGECVCASDVRAKDKDDPCTEGYEQYGMKTKNGKKVPNCVPIKSKADKVKAAEPTPSSEETHDEYMTRCQEAGYTEEECMKAHEGHTFKDQEAPHDEEDHVEGYYDKDKKKKYANECGYGEKMIDGECRKVAVTIELDIEEIEAVVIADTGKTIYEIRGIAFHEGMNKNKWSLTPEGALSVTRQMKDSDLTLMHPKANENGAGFSRNMDGGIEEANVGYIVEAMFFTTEKGYDVRYVAHVTRDELFASLEDGLWQQDDYGVSIGGSGIPVSADEDGIIFGEDFTFDHLALVYRPAYDRANVESVERKELEEAPVISSESEQNIISHSTPAENINPMVIAMTEETMIENTEAMEALQAELVLANSRIAEYEAEAAARVEAERMVLVEKASELGMSGHDDLSTPTLETLIASWEAAHPEPTPVEMTPVESVEKPVEASLPGEEEKPMVENYLNGRLVANDERIYSKAWNAWASAWNKTLAADERSRMSAPSYDAMKEMI